VGKTALGFQSRGMETFPRPAFHWSLMESSCNSCGYCAQVCPTGAICERRPFEKSPPLPGIQETIQCEYCSRGCFMNIWRYGEQVLKVLPKERAEGCSLGRYAVLIGREPKGGWTEDQANALRKALTGDLRALMGEPPKTILGIDCTKKG